MSTHIAVKRQSYDRLLRKAVLCEEVTEALRLVMPLLDKLREETCWMHGVEDADSMNELYHKVKNALSCVDLEKEIAK